MRITNPAVSRVRLHFGLHTIQTHYPAGVYVGDLANISRVSTLRVSTLQPLRVVINNDPVAPVYRVANWKGWYTLEDHESGNGIRQYTLHCVGRYCREKLGCRGLGKVELVNCEDSVWWKYPIFHSFVFLC